MVSHLSLKCDTIFVFFNKNLFTVLTTWYNKHNLKTGNVEKYMKSQKRKSIKRTTKKKIYLYTAEITVHRIEAYLNQYISTSDLLKEIIEADKVMDDTQFNTLAEFMMKGNDA